MRLRDLDAHFVGDLAPDGRSYRVVDRLDDAQGVLFQCPRCAADQMAAGQLEPGSKVDLLFRYGRIGNRIVLLNMPEPSTAMPKAISPESPPR